jgi:acyl-coenzyme A thioesterase PaaI-like protein
MTELSPRIVADERRRVAARNDHYCFGCGHQNPAGLRLTFYEREDGAGVWAPWTPARESEGYAGIVHGGIITTVLDEVMAWSLYQRGIWAVTGKLMVTFRRPVEVGVPTRAEGMFVRDRGRVIEVAGQIRRDADDALLAEATATFLRVPERQAQAWRDRYLV